jgi:hypothetical protein
VVDAASILTDAGSVGHDTTSESPANTRVGKEPGRLVVQTPADSHKHRRQWMRQRLEFLASAFGIDCLTYTVLSNHLHIVLRIPPDVVATWSDQEVAGRWLRLFPQRREEDGSPAEPKEEEIRTITGNPSRLAVGAAGWRW